MNVPIPDGMTFNAWASEVVYQCRAFSMPLPDDEKTWRDWAMRVLQNSTVELPNPIQFMKWQDWASRVIQPLQGV